MQLKEFIKTALDEIVDGVSEARKGRENMISPYADSARGIGQGKIYRDADRECASIIESVRFDIAVAIKTENLNARNSAAKAGASAGGVLVAIGLKASANAESGSEEQEIHNQENTHRIQFSVPVCFNSEKQKVPFGSKLKDWD